MAITIPDELQSFVSRGIASGRFRSEEDAVHEGLRLLCEREEKLNALRADIRIGIDQLERGEGTVIYDEEGRHALIQDIERRGLERISKTKES